MKPEPIKFDAITIESHEPAIKAAILLQKKEIEAIISNPASPDFENTIVALDRSGEELSRRVLALGNLESATGDESLMEISMRLTPLLSKHSADIMLNEKLWQRVSHVYETHKDILKGEDAMLLEETYRGFVRSGAQLGSEDKEEFRKILQRLSELNVIFSQNVANELKNPDRRLWLDESQLEGIPEDIASAARAEASALADEAPEGKKYVFTPYYPSYAPFMKFQADRELRRKLYLLSSSRNFGGERDNVKVLREIANLRLKLANLMGYATYADYSLEPTMAGSRKAVEALLRSLATSYIEPMEKELRNIETFAAKTEGENFTLRPWDYSYWSNKLKQATLDISDEELKPYLRLPDVIKGVFLLAEKLYGYKFSIREELPVYHPDVRVYEVSDAEDRALGLLYADFFNRNGKSPGAWMTEYSSEWREDNGEKHLPAISIVCNFTKPVAGKDVLLTPDEVRTFLHEFGHALHGLSADTKYASLSGTNVRRDFVELFSQFNENYLTEKEWLDSFAEHYVTHGKIPAALIDKFVNSSQFGAAYACVRQLFFGMLDMRYHTITNPLPDDFTPTDFERELNGELSLPEAESGCATSPTFAHIFAGGYAAGYYGYKWSEVLDADAFSVMKEKGIFDRSVASRFLMMMQKGGTVQPMSLYEEFKGSRPSIEALLHRDGIA